MKLEHFWNVAMGLEESGEISISVLSSNFNISSWYFRVVLSVFRCWQLNTKNEFLMNMRKYLWKKQRMTWVTIKKGEDVKKWPWNVNLKYQHKPLLEVERRLMMMSDDKSHEYLANNWSRSFHFHSLKSSKLKRLALSLHNNNSNRLKLKLSDTLVLCSPFSCSQINLFKF